MLGTWVLVFGLSPLDFWKTTPVEFGVLTQEYLDRNEPLNQGMDYEQFLELERKITQNANGR